MSSLTPKHDMEACKAAGECYQTTLSNLKALLKEVEKIECDPYTKNKEKDKCFSETFPPDWSIPPITYPITPEREKQYFMNAKMPWERQKSQIIAGKLYTCNCVKRDGLQADCPLVGCQGSDLCLTRPYPICPPSGNADTPVTDEMAECLLRGLPSYTSGDVSECKENEPCNVKCAECNASLRNICKWNPDFFKPIVNENNDKSAPGSAVPTTDTAPRETIGNPEAATTNQTIDPGLPKINVQFRIGVTTGQNQKVSDNQNKVADPCNGVNKNIEDLRNGVKQNINIDPCNGMNKNIKADPCNGMNNQNSLIPYNGNQNNTAVPYSRVGDPSRQKKYVVHSSDVGNVDKKYYYNRIVDLCSKIQQMDAQCNGMNNKMIDPNNGMNNNMVSPNNGMNQNLANQKNNNIVEVCRRVEYNTVPQNNWGNNKVTDPCLKVINQNTNQSNQMNCRTVDPNNGLNNGRSANNGMNGYSTAGSSNGVNNKNMVVPYNAMNNQNNTTNFGNDSKKSQACSRMVLKFTMVNPNGNGKLANKNNGMNKFDSCIGMNNGNIGAQYNGMNNKMAIPSNGMNNGMGVINNGFNNGMGVINNGFNNGMNQNATVHSNGINSSTPVKYTALNKVPVQSNGMNNANVMAAPNGNQSYMFNCTPYNPTNPNVFWCTMQK